MYYVYKSDEYDILTNNYEGYLKYCKSNKKSYQLYLVLSLITEIILSFVTFALIIHGNGICFITMFFLGACTVFTSFHSNELLFWKNELEFLKKELASHDTNIS